MMECYQKCVEIGKRCSFLGSTGSCADCGKICRSFLTSSQNCRCKTTPACSQHKSRAGIEENQLSVSCPQDHSKSPLAPSRPTSGTHDHSASLPGSSQPTSGSRITSKPLKASIKEEKKEKQSFWQWLLSLVGLGGKKAQEPSDEHTGDHRYDSVKPTFVGSNRPVETFSPQATLEEAVDICKEIKKLKPDLYIKQEQSSPPVAQTREEVSDQKTPPSASPASKKKSKKKQKSPQSSSSDRGKYLGRPLDVTPKKTTSKTSSPSARKDSKSPAQKSPSKTERSPAGGDHPPPTQDNVPDKRPPTSPIYSSEKYLKPYISDLCPQSPDCQECCEFPPTPSQTRQFAKSTAKKKQCGAKVARSPSTPCTMPHPCSCSGCPNKPCPPICCPNKPCPPICCPKPRPRVVCCSKPCPTPCCPKPCPPTCCPNPCPPPCCPKPCPPLCCPTNPCCPTRCSYCSCLADLKRDMKKRRTSPSTCGRSVSKNTRRRRSSSCPSSPICGPCPCPCSCCPLTTCYPSCGLPRSCPPTPTCCPPVRTSLSCGTSCRTSSYKPSSNFCPPTVRSCKSPSSACGSMPCLPPTCAFTSCPVTPSCPITCMKPCCLPCMYKCSTLDTGMSPFKFAPTFSSGTCAINSYNKSRDNDSFCKKLMAKYNITAPEPRAFCPLPRNTCPPCDVRRTIGPQTFSSSRAPGCPSCGPTSCYNNNRSLSVNQSHVLSSKLLAGCSTSGQTPSYNNNKPLPYTGSYAYAYEHSTECANSYKISPPCQQQVNDPITFNTSPSHSSPRMVFRIPQRTPVECIKKTGPRSPCREYMSTHSFGKDSKKEKGVKEVVPVDETTPPVDVKAGEHQQRSSRKPKKRTSQKQLKETSTEKEGGDETAQNTSENKAINENATSLPSGLLTWRMSVSRAQRNRSQSRAKQNVKKILMEEKESTLPTNYKEDSTTHRYSSVSKSFYPLFLSLSSSSHPTSQAMVKVPSPRVGCRHNKMASPKSLIEEVSTSNLCSSSSFSRRNSINSKLSFTEVANMMNYHATPKPIRLNVSKSFDGVYRQPKKNWSFLSAFDFRSPCQLAEIALPEDTHAVVLNMMAKKGDDDLVQLKNVGIKESESHTAFPKVESISSLVEKFDSVEVSTIGVMAQSKYNVFDYISAESPSAITLSINEDPSLSIIEELAVKENVSTETDSQAHKGNECVESSTLGDPIQNMEKIDQVEMSRGTSKVSHVQGDARRQRDSNLASSKDQVDTIKISESVGDNPHAPMINLKLDTMVRGIKVQQCSHVCATGESSVDPAEFGIIGESAVDPIGSNQNCSAVTQQTNQSNNKPFDSSDPKIDAVQPTETETQGEAESAASGTVTQHGEVTNMSKLDDKKIEAKLVSEPDQLLDGGEASSGKTSTEMSSEHDHSNNKSDETGEPEDKAVEYGAMIGEGEPVKPGNDAILGGKKEAGESEAISKPMSTLEDILSSSGVVWSKVTEATEADIKLLHLGKTAFVRRTVAPPTDRDEGMAKAPNQSPVKDEPDPKPYLNLLKPGQVESSELCSGTHIFPSDSAIDQIKNYGTPV